MIFKSTNQSTFCEELCAQLGISIPTMASFLLYKIPWLISLHFAGNLGSLELAAVSLAGTICNVTGLSLSVGMSSALTTLAGQARGDLLRQKERTRSINNDSLSTASTNVSDSSNQNEHNEDVEVAALVGSREMESVENSNQTKNYGSVDKEDTQFLVLQNGDRETQDNDDKIVLMPLTYLYRGIFIQMLFVLPVGFWWLHGIDTLLVRLGQDEEVSKMASVYLKVLTPGLWSYSINFTMNSWLQSMDLAYIPAYGGAIGVLIHIPMNILLVRVFNLGYIGVGLATISYQIIQPLFVCLYLFGTEKGRMEVMNKLGGEKLSFWKESYVAISSLSGILQYLSLAVPGILVISEWWASEITIFMSGRLHPNALGAMAIYQSINGCCFMFSVGTSVAVSVRVATWLGKDNPLRAKLSSKIGLICACILTLSLSCVLYVTPHTYFPSFFTHDKYTIDQASSTIPYLVFYIFADGMQAAYNGIIKGCGRQLATIPIVFVAYWVVGVPLAYQNVFVARIDENCQHCGVVGLVDGLTVGTWVHFILMAALVIFTTNWSKEAKSAQQRMSLEQKK